MQKPLEYCKIALPLLRCSLVLWMNTQQHIQQAHNLLLNLYATESSILKYFNRSSFHSALDWKHVKNQHVKNVKNPHFFPQKQCFSFLASLRKQGFAFLSVLSSRVWLCEAYIQAGKWMTSLFPHFRTNYIAFRIEIGVKSSKRPQKYVRL